MRVLVVIGRRAGQCRYPRGLQDARGKARTLASTLQREDRRVNKFNKILKPEKTRLKCPFCKARDAKTSTCAASARAPAISGAEAAVPACVSVSVLLGRLCLHGTGGTVIWTAL